MANYRIVCVELKYPTQHRHITGVGTGANPNAADNQWTVQQVRSAIDRGDTFYTQSPTTAKVAYVDKFDCSCGYKTIKSRADAVQDNNLDYMRACSWKA